MQERVRDIARERGISFKEALNSAVRQGLDAARPSASPYRTPSRPLGLRPGVGMDKALQHAGDLEDEETIHRLQRGA